MPNKNNENATAVFTPPEEMISITIPDLQTILSIIETASERGGFKANELMMVGTMYNKVHTFVQAAIAQQNQMMAGPTVEEHNRAMGELAKEDTKETTKEKEKK